MAINLRKPIRPALILTAVVLLLNYLFNAIGYAVQPLFATIAPVSPVTGTVGQRFLGWLGGYIPVGELLSMGIVYTLISAYVILLIGGLLIDRFKLPAAKGRIGALASQIIWGAIPLYLLIVGLVYKDLNVIIGLLIYTIPAAYLTAYVEDRFFK